MNECIFGIDIIRGSVRSRTIQPHYAFARIEQGTVSSEEEKMSLGLDLCAISTPNSQKFS
jgi:predicted RNase H-like nuclease (RuvC/YqgF family)